MTVQVPPIGSSEPRRGFGAQPRLPRKHQCHPPQDRGLGRDANMVCMCVQQGGRLALECSRN